MTMPKPVRPVMIIASDKVAKFSAQKPDPTIASSRKQLVATFRANGFKSASKTK